tara:strand:- start:1112 stop:1669 length:558 start_codon:yes stop_codon:yes gene_type:complete
MPNGNVRNYNHKKLTNSLREFFDFLKVGDIVTIHEVIDYLESLPYTKLKDLSIAGVRQGNRRLKRRQLFSSKNYFNRVIYKFPDVISGILHSHYDNYRKPLKVYVKTNENRDIVCFNCEEYVPGGAKRFDTLVNKSTATMSKYIMCGECYKYEIKMFSPNNEYFADGFEMAYGKWEKKRDWSEEE